MRSKKRPYRATQGALLTIAVLFVGSGLARLGSGTGLALAREVGSLSEHADTAPREGGNCAAAGTLLTELRAREERVARRESDLEELGRNLELAEDEISRQMAALEAAETRLRDLVVIADEAAKTDIDRLTSVYENMKPKDAARLFEEMEPDFAAGFLGQMRPDAAAQIMAGLSPAAAYGVSVVLAGRNVQVQQK